MFAGIVTDIGTVEERKELKKGIRLCISSCYVPKNIGIGASISCSGICLTVVSFSASSVNMNLFEVEAWGEALRLTTLPSWRAGTRINLEHSLKLGDEIGGHLVAGHVDGVAEIQAYKDEGESRSFEIKIPDHFVPFIASKGSVCLNGTSLTVNQVEKNIFYVLLIRHTLNMTTWNECRVGDLVNIEVDQLSRYAIRSAEYIKRVEG